MEKNIKVERITGPDWLVIRHEVVVSDGRGGKAVQVSGSHGRLTEARTGKKTWGSRRVRGPRVTRATAGYPERDSSRYVLNGVSFNTLPRRFPLWISPNLNPQLTLKLATKHVVSPKPRPSHGGSRSKMRQTFGHRAEKALTLV
jgi:hypothetical protein